MAIKKMAVAGQFYPNDADKLTENINSYIQSATKDSNYFSRMIIVPHAGHAYSGKLAVKGYRYLKQDTETIVIFAPAHRLAFEGIAVSSYDAFDTPLGKLDTDKNITEFIKNNGAEVNDKAFVNEHSVEVHLPFIRYFFKNVKIVPVLVGGVNFHKITEIVESLWENKKIAFVISSDLSHFRTKQQAARIDYTTADMIENNISENIIPEQACGYIGVSAVVNFAKKHNYSFIRLGLTDSSEKTGEESSVVGYGAWFLAEQEKNEFIAEHYGDFLKQLVQISIKSQLENINMTVDNYPKALETRGAAFVTLEIGGVLRGCIGSIIGVEPLIVDVCKNARNAAFKDPRFIPLEAKEFDSLEITISILSRPELYSFDGEEDLLKQITPYTDGVIIKDVGRQAVYLPEVWKQIPDKKDFLNSLKQKAGLAPDWFSKTFEAYRFTAQVIK